jgi:hypothetical protein
MSDWRGLGRCRNTPDSWCRHTVNLVHASFDSDDHFMRSWSFQEDSIFVFRAGGSRNDGPKPQSDLRSLTRTMPDGLSRAT